MDAELRELTEPYWIGKCSRHGLQRQLKADLTLANCFTQTKERKVAYCAECLKQPRSERVEIQPVMFYRATRDESRQCTKQCLTAMTTPKCTCACGGENHGIAISDKVRASFQRDTER